MQLSQIKNSNLFKLITIFCCILCKNKGISTASWEAGKQELLSVFDICTVQNDQLSPATGANAGARLRTEELAKPGASAHLLLQ